MQDVVLETCGLVVEDGEGRRQPPPAPPAAAPEEVVAAERLCGRSTRSASRFHSKIVWCGAQPDDDRAKRLYEPVRGNLRRPKWPDQPASSRRGQLADLATGADGNPDVSDTRPAMSADRPIDSFPATMISGPVGQSRRTCEMRLSLLTASPMDVANRGPPGTEVHRARSAAATPRCCASSKRDRPLRSECAK